MQILEVLDDATFPQDPSQELIGAWLIRTVGTTQIRCYIDRLWAYPVRDDQHAREIRQGGDEVYTVYLK